VAAFDDAEPCGFRGHLVNLSNELVKLSNYSVPVAVLLEGMCKAILSRWRGWRALLITQSTGHEGWNYFVATTLQETNEIEMAPIRGNGAFNEYDEDYESDDSPVDYGYNSEDSDDNDSDPDQDLEFIESARDEIEELGGSGGI
jgi:hypothetical protein